MVLDLRMAALVGMAACFAGSSRALFASIVFALEISQQFNALMPLLAACATAFLVSAANHEHDHHDGETRPRGTHVPSDYVAHRL